MRLVNEKVYEHSLCYGLSVICHCSAWRWVLAAAEFHLVRSMVERTTKREWHSKDLESLIQQGLLISFFAYKIQNKALDVHGKGCERSHSWLHGWLPSWIINVFMVDGLSPDEDPSPTLTHACPTCQYAKKRFNHLFCRGWSQTHEDKLRKFSQDHGRESHNTKNSWLNGSSHLDSDSTEPSDDPTQEHSVYKLKKGLYGLMQASRWGYKKLNCFMVNQQCKRMALDH